jgi:argininosuccinate synthase
MEEIKKVVLAYSGGLDTSVIVHWLQEQYHCEVITYTSDLGVEQDLVKTKERALKIGATRAIVEDLRQEFIENYAFKALRANAVYDNKYVLSTALARPLMAQRLVQIIEEEQADAVCHGCTAKGNDQVRFEVSIMALAPYLKIIAPLRTWDMKTRAEEVAYAEKHQIPLEINKEQAYSIDANLWGAATECGVLEDPWNEPPVDAYYMTTSWEQAPDNPEIMELEFEKGYPTKINGESYAPVDMVVKLNEIGARHAIGRTDLIENRIVGIKSREIYDAPAATMLMIAHRDLEQLTLDRETLYFKEQVNQKYGQLVYNGYWFSTLRESLDAFIDRSQENVTGTVRLKLYKGNCIVIGRKSPYSLYDEKLATYGTGDIYSHESAKGFINLWGLPIKVQAAVEQTKKNQSK